MNKYYNRSRAKRLRENFDKLPDRAKEMFFVLCGADKENGTSNSIGFAIDNEFYICGQSPIEQIFYFGFEMAIYLDRLSDPSYTSLLYIEPQYRITRNDGGTYIADFMIHSDCGDRYLIIECDGHEFHEKTKEQVAYRNDRDIELKSLGYDVIHLNGSQIYKEPFKYVSEIYEYFKKMIGAKNG